MLALKMKVELLHELYQRGLRQPKVGTDLYAGDGMLMFWSHMPIAPWQDADWFADMRRSLRDSQYLRMIENLNSSRRRRRLSRWSGTTALWMTI